MGKNRTAGIIAVRKDKATREVFVLFVTLRWTRSGFKTLMHCLNGAEKVERASRAVQNCTDDELAHFLGADDESGDAAVDRLWSDATVPRSWTVDKGPAGLAAARATRERLAKSARGERERRARGGDCRRDDLSKTSSQIPKGVVDAGETPWTAALRELEEEAGVVPGEVRRLGSAPAIRKGALTAFAVTLPASRNDGWRVENSPETTEASMPSLADLKACMRRCEACPRCAAVSVSSRRRMCMWFAAKQASDEPCELVEAPSTMLRTARMLRRRVDRLDDFVTVVVSKPVSA